MLFLDVIPTNKIRQLKTNTSLEKTAPITRNYKSKSTVSAE